MAALRRVDVGVCSQRPRFNREPSVECSASLTSSLPRKVEATAPLSRMCELHHEPILNKEIEHFKKQEEGMGSLSGGLMNLGVVVNVLGGEGTRPVPASNGAAVLVAVSSLLGLPERVCTGGFCCQADL